MTVEVVVLDASAFPRGLFRRDLLEEWASEAASSDLEIWIPEVVAWELASHVADEWESLQPGERRLRRAGLTLPPAFPDREAVIDSVLEQMHEVAKVGPVVITEIPADFAREALRDQILGRPPAEKRGGARVGAADTAWLKEVLDALPPEGIAIVSDDGGISKRLEAWEVEGVVVAKDWHAMRKQVFTLTAAPAQIIEAVGAYVEAAIRGGTWEEDLGIDAVDPDPLEARLIEEVWQGWEPLFATAEVTRLEELVALEDVDINPRGGDVSAVVVLAAEVLVTAWFDDRDGKLVPAMESVPGVTLEVPMLFGGEGDEITTAAASGEAEITARPPD